MQAALARHDALLRHAIESAGGCIVKSTGDGVYAVFADAADALAACLAAQRALQAPETDASNPEPAASDAATADRADECGWACTRAWRNFGTAIISARR